MMKSFFKKILIRSLYYSGVSRAAASLLDNKIFCVGYHSIYDEKNMVQLRQELYPNIAVSRKNFEEQLLLMKKNRHTFIRFSDLKTAQLSGMKKPTVIFFDDGFMDVFINALPVLRKYDIPATVFATTGLMDRTHIMWTVGLRAFLYRQGLDAASIEKKISEFKKFKMKEREEKLFKLYADHDFILDPKEFNIFLDWENLKTLSQNNVEIGSHSVSHQKLVELDDAVLERELVDSKKRIEVMLSQSVSTISYPYGRFNQRVVDAAQKAGYSLGMTTVAGHNNASEIAIKPFEIKRMDGPEPEDTIVDFQVKLYMNI